MKDDLFQLIKSLDKNEKGYFKKLTARYGAKSSGNDYLKLFDLLDKTAEYDETKIKKRFSKAGKKFNLSAQKIICINRLCMRCARIHPVKILLTICRSDYSTFKICSTKI